MTETEVARTPLPYNEIDPEQMWQTLRWLLNVGKLVAEQTEKGSADVHKTLRSLKEALHNAEDLLYPPPEPEGPEGGLLLHGHAVRPGDEVYVGAHMVAGLREGAWVKVRTATRTDAEWVEWVTNDPTGRLDRLTMAFPASGVPFGVKRPPQQPEQEWMGT